METAAPVPIAIVFLVLSLIGLGFEVDSATILQDGVPAGSLTVLDQDRSDGPSYTITISAGDDSEPQSVQAEASDLAGQIWLVHGEADAPVVLDITPVLSAGSAVTDGGAMREVAPSADAGEAAAGVGTMYILTTDDTVIASAPDAGLILVASE